MPTPTVNLIFNGPLYEGTSHTLICIITLPQTVDTDITITVDWTMDNTIITNTSGRVIISPVSSMSPPFISTLTFHPLTINDAGQYSCHATANSSSQYIITTSTHGQSTTEALIVNGNLQSD